MLNIFVSKGTHAHISGFFSSGNMKIGSKSGIR